MRVFLFAAALLSAVQVCAVQPVLAMDKEKLLEAYFGVVLIRGFNANGGLAYGSGVVVGKDKVITNCHVFRATK